MNSRRSPLTLLACALLAVGCDDTPHSTPDVERDAGDPWHRQSHDIPLPGRLEILFVIDEGPTMCQEQDTLTRGLDAFSTFVVEELAGAVELRVATVGAGLDPARGVPGAISAAPAPAVPSAVCFDGQGDPGIPNTADCPALIEAGALPPVLATGPRGNVGLDCAGDPAADAACVRDDLARRLRCMATPGTGANAGQGLEAMRLALDCAGPNRALFGECCVDGGTGRGRVYDPACAPAVAPQFLDPEARLLVVFVSDRDDCSGAPDAERCATAGLAPLAGYFDFLIGLKARPLEQLGVVALVGPPGFTPGGAPIVWTDDPPLDGCPPGDTTDRCCPDGRCRGPEAPSCTSANGDAYAGDRYIEFAAAFEDSRACRAPTDLAPNAAPAQACAGLDPSAACQWVDPLDATREGRCMPMPSGGLACADCPTICADDYAAALDALRPVVGAPRLGPYCLDAAPPCVVEAADGAQRACASAAERADAGNYPIRVRLTCPAAHAAYCADAEGPLDRGAWSVRFEAAGCPHDVMLWLDEAPPPGSVVHIVFPRAD